MFKDVLLFAFIALLFTACGDDKYFLKWNVQEGAPLVYKTEMQIVDSLSSVSEKQNILKLMESMGSLMGDTLNSPVQMSDIQSDINKWMNSYHYFSILKKKGNSIHIEVAGKSMVDPNMKYLGSFGALPKEMSLYQGQVLNNGVLESKYNIPKFTIMFELPEKEVSVGDSWPLSMKFKVPDVSSELETENAVNRVKFVDVLKKGEDLIAILQYEIKSPQSLEYSAFGGAIHFKGRGDFNITKGKWEKLEGYYVTASAGFSVMKQTEKIRLTEASVSEFNSFLAYKAPDELKIVPVKKQEAKIKKENTPILDKKKVLEKSVKENTEHKKIDCPVLYSVQVLAAKSRVLPDSKEFRGFNYMVQERISDKNNEIYRYKYTVGNFCSIDKARKRLSEIRNSGFPKAFIVKRTNN